ncbi:copper resistance protein CopC [Micromonospora sp. NPDC092111]|uniref:copper resistance CopC family protein n=1 Tax=Micromonospora sp. NPDC092111 TaxID=3364289 RepID=UPI00381E7BF1
MRCSPPAARRAGRAVSGLFALVLLSAVAVLGSAPPAAAHGTLAMSAPATGATVAEPLAAVELYFTEKVAGNAYFTITAPGGGRVDNGWAHGAAKPLDKPVREYLLVDGKFEPREYATGYPAVVTLAHLPAVGQYSVSYLSVASDGEPVRGTMSFRYTGRVTTPPQGWRPPTNQPDPSLVAAAEQHATSGHGSAATSSAPATPAAASAPPGAAAPSTAPDDEGGPGRWVWTAGAVAAVAAVAGLVGWRRRAPVGRAAGRARVAGAAPRRPGGGSRPGRGTGATGRTGADRRAAASGAGGRATRAAVSPARRGRAADTARTAVAAVPAAAVPAAVGKGATATAVDPADGRSPAVTVAPDVAAEADGEAPTVGARLSNTGLALFVGGLVVALLAGFGLGRIGTADGRSVTGGQTATGGALGTGPAVSAGDGHQHGPGTGAHTHPGDGGTGQAQVTGMAVSAGGYTLQPVARSQPVGERLDYRFRIVGPDRQPATRFAVVHDKPLHLVVVGRDLSGYQHLHPTMTADGTWSVPLTLPRAGGYRIYADFSVTGADGTALPLVLGVDHQVPGAHVPAALPPAQSQAAAGPFTVSMGGTPTVGVTVPLSFRVGGSGPPGPPRLERYLGAYGHLVVVREGDLGYVHVHPEPELVDGTVKFWLTAPSTGRYRAFFDFQVDGTVHTAEYTIEVG